MLTAIELFSGIGGFRHLTESLGIKFVGWCEKDKYCQKLYRAYYKTDGEYFCDDAVKINTGELPDFDILFAGFPCQPFSIAGKRQGFADTRGTIFFEIERICRDKKPKYIVLENVKGLLTHDNRRTFLTIIRILTDIGYTCEWQVLNSKFFGVPHRRERVYIIGHLGKEPGRKIFPIRKNSEWYIQGTRKTAVNTLTAGGNSGGLHSHMALIYWKNSKEKWTEDSRGISPTLKTHNDLCRQPLLKIGKDIVRRFTPIEWCRLQGFSDDLHKKAVEISISDTQCFKIFGNAVTATIPPEIVKRLIEKD